MILIESVKYRHVVGPIYELRHISDPGHFLSGQNPEEHVVTSETVIGDRFVTAHGQRLEIAMSKQVRDLIGLPLNCFQEQQTERLRADALAQAPGVPVPTRRTSMVKPIIEPCPFCSGKPTFEFRMDKEPTESGHIGHYAVMAGCCRVIGRRTELFFTRPDQPANPELWKSMCDSMIRDWNFRRVA